MYRVCAWLAMIVQNATKRLNGNCSRESAMVLWSEMRVRYLAETADEFRRGRSSLYLAVKKH